MFKHNEDEYNIQIEKLNLAFKGALQSTTLTPMYAYNPGNLQAFREDQEVERIQFEEESAKTIQNTKML